MRLLHEMEVASVLRLSSLQVLKLAKKGELPFIRLPGGEIRFDEAEIARYIDNRRVPVADHDEGTTQ